MDKNNTFYNVKNRSAGTVSYNIPEDRINRFFAAGETKKNISFSELEKLSFQPGGRRLMLDYLQIENAEIVDKLNIPAEQEYWYSEEEIKKLLIKGSLDALKDCLDFAPSGVIDLLKKYAVELPVNDIEKRDAILENTGFDVTKAIANMEKERAEENEITSNSKNTQRRVPESAQKKERRVSTNDGPSTKEEIREAITPINKTVTGYKIVSKDDE